METFFQGFEKQAKFKLKDVEHRLGFYLTEPYDTARAEQEIDKAKSESFALRHPIVSGLASFGLWPRMAKAEAARDIADTMIRSSPIVRDQLKGLGSREKQHHREVLSSHDEADRTRALRSAAMTGPAAALLGLNDYLEHQARMRSQPEV
jgi:hypothetical protein